MICGEQFCREQLCCFRAGSSKCKRPLVGRAAVGYWCWCWCVAAASSSGPLQEWALAGVQHNELAPILLSHSTANRADLACCVLCVHVFRLGHAPCGGGACSGGGACPLLFSAESPLLLSLSPCGRSQSMITASQHHPCGGSSPAKLTPLPHPLSHCASVEKLQRHGPGMTGDCSVRSIL